MPTPPPSPLTSLSPPSAGERLARSTTPSVHSSPPPVPSSSLPSSGYPTQIQALRIASTQALINVVTAALPLPSLPPPLYIPSHVDRRDDIPKTELPPRKKPCLFALGLRYEVEESSTARPIEGRGIDYGFVSTLDAEARRRRIREGKSLLPIHPRPLLLEESNNPDTTYDTLAIPWNTIDSADAAIVVPTVEPVSLLEGIEPVIPPPSTDVTTTGARITVRLQASISLPPEVEVERLLSMPTPPPSPLTSLSPPSAGERLARCTTPSAHSSPPPVPSSSLPSSGCPTQIQALRIASTQALIDVITAALPSPPLPPPLYMPPHVDRRDDIPETELLPRKKSCLFAIGLRYEVEDSSTARPTGGRRINYGFVSTLDAKARRRRIKEVGYSIRDTWVDPAEAVPEITPMTLGEVNTRVTELAEIHEHDTQDLYALLKDAQDSRTRISQRVTMDSQRVDLLMKDRIAHQETILIVKEEAYAS
nr:hypothetical protein [Tanacetum cinerariifolium]